MIFAIIKNIKIIQINKIEPIESEIKTLQLPILS